MFNNHIRPQSYLMVKDNDDTLTIDTDYVFDFNYLTNDFNELAEKLNLPYRIIDHHRVGDEDDRKVKKQFVMDLIDESVLKTIKRLYTNDFLLYEKYRKQ